MVVESVCQCDFLVDTQPRRAHELRSRSIVGYTFRRHKLRFMSNAKLRTTTLLRYGSSSQKSAAHIFGNPDYILLPVCFQSCARLWRSKLQIVFHKNLLIFSIEKVADLSSSPTLACVGISRNAVLNCLLLLHNFASLFFPKNKKIRTNANRPLNGNLLRADYIRLLNCRLYLKNCTTTKPILQTAFLRLKCLSQELPLFKRQPYGKATVILRYDLFVARLVTTIRKRADE